MPKIYTPNKSYSSSMATIAPLIEKAIVPIIPKISQVTLKILSPYVISNWMNNASSAIIVEG
jgi:hypothetical protein